MVSLMTRMLLHLVWLVALTHCGAMAEFYTPRLSARYKYICGIHPYGVGAANPLQIVYSD